jgi:hypothetical protein
MGAVRNLLRRRVAVAVDRDGFDAETLEFDDDFLAELAGAEQHYPCRAFAEWRSEFQWVPGHGEYFKHASDALTTASSGSARDLVRCLIRRQGHPRKHETEEAVPDFEIRLYYSDGSLALVHVSHHLTEQQADAHARRIVNDLARYEIRRVATATADDVS